MSITGLPLRQSKAVPTCFAPRDAVRSVRVTHSTLGRAKLRRVQCPAASRQSKSFDETDTLKEADWLLDDDVFEDEEEEDGYVEEEGLGVSGRLQVSQDGPEASPQDVEDDRESRDFAIAMAKVGWDTKAEGVRLLHVAPLVYWTSYMVVLNIKSRPQLQAVIAKMERLAEEQYNRKLSPMAETSRGSEWEVLDYIDVVVHIFTEKQRAFYDLDGYYGMAEDIELPFLKEEQKSIPWAKNAKV